MKTRGSHRGRNKKSKSVDYLKPPLGSKHQGETSPSSSTSSPVLKEKRSKSLGDYGHCGLSSRVSSLAWGGERFIVSFWSNKVKSAPIDHVMFADLKVLTCFLRPAPKDLDNWTCTLVYFFLGYNSVLSLAQNHHRLLMLYFLSSSAWSFIENWPNALCYAVERWPA